MREARHFAGRASFIVDTRIVIHQAELQGANEACSLEALSTCCFTIQLGRFHLVLTMSGRELETTQAGTSEVPYDIESSRVSRGNHAVNMSQQDLLKEPLHRSFRLLRRARKIRQRLNGHPGKSYGAMDRGGTKIDLGNHGQPAGLSHIGRDEIHEDDIAVLPAARLIAPFPQLLRSSRKPEDRLHIHRVCVHDKTDNERLPSYINLDNKIQLSMLAPGIFDTRRLDDYLSTARHIPLPAVNSFAQLLEQRTAYSFELSENAPEQGCSKAMVFIRIEEISQAGDNEPLCAFIVDGDP